MAQPIRYPWSRSGEILLVETPEQTRIEHRVASLAARGIASLLDRLWVALLTIGLFVAAMIVASAAGAWHGDLPAWTLAALVIAWFLLTMLWLAWREIAGAGQTWGKRRLRVRTVLATGQGLTVGAALVRNLARVVDDLPLLWLVPLLTPGQRRIGDLLAGTIVVVEPELREHRRRRGFLDALAPSYRELAEPRFALPAGAARALLADDLDLLEYLEGRLSTLPPGRRPALLREVALRYARRLRLDEQRARIEEQPERFLQELGLYLRERFERDHG